ncbi:acyltransferase [Acinetobacter towneri]|uniref:acyltransferase n=1 Tax=Acinetobacter towneri TaxID=202956 RepID=UPI0002D03956|nr:acyltransferase [Acinetobacter towneri]ENV70840.1 hypothetical protein F947_00250 [Acinetobacter towneri DSM 14962 = CIP 107472]
MKLLKEMEELVTKLNDQNFIYLKKIAIHTEKSMYFEFPINDEIIVTTINHENKTLCIYSRSHKEIKNIEKILNFLSFKNKINTKSIYCSLDKTDYDFQNKILKIAISFEKYNINNKKINIKNLKEYKDINNNEILNTINSTIENVFVNFKGKNNKLIILEKSILKNINIDFKLNNSQIVIGNNPRLKCDIKIGEDCNIYIGHNITSTGKLYITAAESSKVIIEDDCMFATNNQIRTDDAHPIYDSTNGKRLNFSKDVIIKNHVWVAYGACLFGGANVGQGSVIGAFSFVKGKFPNNCIIAGTPAKIIRKNIFWDRKSLVSNSIFAEDYSTDNMFYNYINITNDTF